MTQKTLIKSNKFPNTLASAVADLYDKPNTFGDVEVHVGNTTSILHKVILAVQSPYFQQCLFSAAQPVVNITLADIEPDIFKNVVRYMYKGEIELDSDGVAGILRAAQQFRLDDLKQACAQFMRDTVTVETCVLFWQFAQDLDDADLADGCLTLFAHEFGRMTEPSRLQDITPDMMLAAVDRDDLDVGSEVELCDVLLLWIDIIRENCQPLRPFPLLSRIRWSAIDIDYIESKIIGNETVDSDPTCTAYLSKVIEYRTSGIQFPGLRTRHRPSTGLETSVVIFGIENSEGAISLDGSCRATSDNSWRVGLQSHGQRIAIDDVPVAMTLGAAAACCAATSGSAYVSGIGDSASETWRWDSIGEWTRCGDLIRARTRHCAAFVGNSSMYALGGWDAKTKTTLTSVERFDTTTEQWTTVGQLAQCALKAGCAACGTSIYLFGGRFRDKPTNRDDGLDCIQEYDTTTQQGTVLAHSLPRPELGLLDSLRAALWDKSFVLINNWTCIIFDLDEKTVHQRCRFAAGADCFALALDDQMIFVIGGWNYEFNNRGKCIMVKTDMVKSIPVMDIVEDRQTVSWTQHAKLQSPCAVNAFATMALQNA